MNDDNSFKFAISLSVLDHLGRNLYRNFITVIGEAISNSWDADAKNVWIEFDNDMDKLVVKDDGNGMDRDDFQGKFLKIGYSKRGNDDATNESPKGRPYIGRKGIGKLALLSCANKIHILSKQKNKHSVSGVIDNNALDKAIKDDALPSQYSLENTNKDFMRLIDDHTKGTIICFQDLKDNIKKNTIPTLRKLIALYFRFSLIDHGFHIHLNDDEITLQDLKELSDKTQFLWDINNCNDPFLDTLKNLNKTCKTVENQDIKGFIASVQIPSQLNIFGSSEKCGIDLFVNGRLRETNILKHRPAFLTRHIASYLYGQIHLGGIDAGKSDPFTTSREGVKLENKKYQEFLETINQDVLRTISDEWDEWRIGSKQDGDIENTAVMPKHRRRLEESKNYRAQDFKEKIEAIKLDKNSKEKLYDKLKDLAVNNAQVYQDLFILENLFREFLKNKGINSIDDINSHSPKNDFMKECVKKISQVKKSRKDDEQPHALKGKIVKEEHDLNYLDLVCLAMLVDVVLKSKTGRYEAQTLEAHSKEITPVRNPIMHTNEITDDVMNWDKIKNIIDYVEKFNETGA